MRKFALLSVLILPVIASADSPPIAPTKPHKIQQNGQARNDPYFWLRQRHNPEVIRYLEEENTYTQKNLDQTLQNTLYKEIRSRIKEDDSTVPERIGDYLYYSRTETGKQYHVHCRKKHDLTAPEEILLDENELARNSKFFELGTFEPSPDQQFLAYSVDTTGGEQYTLHIKDLRTGKLLTDSISDIDGDVAWTNDNQHFFYVRKDAAQRPYLVFRHRLGQKSDKEIFKESDERFFVSVSNSRSRSYVFISTESELSSEVQFLPADQPESNFQIVEPRREKILYQVEHRGDTFYIVTNDQAENFKLMQAPVTSPGREHWTEFTPYDPGIYVESVEAFRDYLVIEERKNGLRGLRVHQFSTNSDHEVSFDEPTFELSLGDNPEFDSNTLRFDFESLVTPPEVVDYGMKDRVKAVRKETVVLGGYDRTNYIEERIFAKAADEVEVPISLFYRKDLTRDGSAALWLEGYGAYGISSDADFSSSRMSLVDRGFVFAIAHVRGGGELGRTWYEDGKLLRKKNTFTDFICCAEYLVQQKYVAPHKITISGASAGGLLMGAVMNMRPDLFRNVIADVPFVDLLNTMSDPTLPLTITEYEEWGNPATSEFYNYMASYSPYDNLVASKQYPNLLALGGLNDSRVSYWEPAKWVAKQRAMNLGPRTVLLQTNMGAGHGGASGRFNQMREEAMEYAFAISHTP
ncbi:MAG: S9 family peptidase [Verrucomicrobia bacterium]|nr:S9 family peptidase [Verrucomicrobiota bacterium]